MSCHRYIRAEQQSVMQLSDAAILEGRVEFDENPWEPVLSAEGKQRLIEKEEAEG